MTNKPEELKGYQLAGRKIVMYPDLNFAGRLFGGQLMSWIDEVLAAVERARGAITEAGDGSERSRATRLPRR